jgi:hypothetical protein
MGIVFLVRTAITIFWIMDILNMPFMEMFDTIYPLNGMFWLLVWIFVLAPIRIITEENEKS